MNGWRQGVYNYSLAWVRLTLPSAVDGRWSDGRMTNMKCSWPSFSPAARGDIQAEAEEICTVFRVLLWVGEMRVVCMRRGREKGGTDSPHDCPGGGLHEGPGRDSVVESHSEVVLRCSGEALGPAQRSRSCERKRSKLTAAGQVTGRHMTCSRAQGSMVRKGSRGSKYREQVAENLGHGRVVDMTEVRRSIL
jgi:hypothetical protein